MIVAAHLRQLRMSPQKVRLVADQIRGLKVEKALDVLNFSSKKAAVAVRKVVESAIANAENNLGADIDELKIAEIYVNQGSVLKRFRPRAKGRGFKILKQSCHITVKVSDDERTY